MSDFLSKCTSALGSVTTIILVIIIILLWAAAGPFMHYSDSWQLIINTSTTISTGLMAFIILHTQNRDSRAIQTKLDEIVRSLVDADSALVGIEALPEKEIKELQKKVHEEAAS